MSFSDENTAGIVRETKISWKMRGIMSIYINFLNFLKNFKNSFI